MFNDNVAPPNNSASDALWLGNGKCLNFEQDRASLNLLPQ